MHAGDRPLPPTPRRRKLGAAVRLVAVDLTPLRTSRDYRLLWLGQLVSDTGHQMAIVALFYQVWLLTRSPAAVGVIGLVQLVPLIITSTAGGTVVDAVDRRKLLLAAQAGYASASVALLAGTLAGRPPVALLYAAAAAIAGLSGIDAPNRTAMVPRLVGDDALPSAIALNQVRWNAAMIAGPALGGILIARSGIAAAYAVDAATYGAAIAAALAMRPMPPLAPEGERVSGLRAVREALAFVRRRRLLLSTFAIDLVAMVFGLPRALFPVLATVQLHRGPEVVGALFSALAVGALAGALTAGWVGRVRAQGRAVIVAVAVWGAAITAFGLAGRALWLALACLAAAGAADLVSAVFRTTILQLAAPDHLRGRLSALHILVVTGGPRLGDLEAGLVAELVSPTFSVVTGGLACVAGVGLLALWVPELRRYRTP